MKKREKHEKTCVFHHFYLRHKQVSKMLIFIQNMKTHLTNSPKSCKNPQTYSQLEPLYLLNVVFVFREHCSLHLTAATKIRKNHKKTSFFNFYNFFCQLLHSCLVKEDIIFEHFKVFQKHVRFTRWESMVFTWFITRKHT